MKLDFKLTRVQVNKLYALVGCVVSGDEDIREVRSILSIAISELGIYEHYQAELSLDGKPLSPDVTISIEKFD